MTLISLKEIWEIFFIFLTSLLAAWSHVLFHLHILSNINGIIIKTHRHQLLSRECACDNLKKCTTHMLIYDVMHDVATEINKMAVFWY